MKKAVIISILVLALATGAIYLYRQKNLLEASDFKFYKARINTIGLAIVDVTTVFIIENKSDIDIELIDQEYDVLINEKIVSKVRSTKIVVLKRASSVPVEINIRFNPQTVIGTAWDNMRIYLKDASKITIRIKGFVSFSTAAVNMNKMPVDHSMTLEQIIQSTK